MLDSIASHIADAVSSAITAILDDLQTPTASLELARSLLQRWNLEAPLALEACVHEQFREVALAQPERPAIHSSDNDLTYEKLDDLSDRLARKLQQKGVRAEIIVPMLCEKSSVAVVCCLAIMKAGAALLPLDPSHPSERLAAIVHDCGALLAITTASCMNQVEKLCQTVLPIDMGYYERLPADHDVQSDSSTPSNACAVIYTSGSSGTPKGIVLIHSNFSTAIAAGWRYNSTASHSSNSIRTRWARGAPSRPSRGPDRASVSEPSGCDGPFWLFTNQISANVPHLCIDER